MIYLDSAATSLLKPDGVQYAVLESMNTMTSPGRGAHSPAMKAAELCYDCREKLAELFNVDRTENIIFTFNATHALNIAINSLVKYGDRVVISGFEHNSVTRPLKAAGAELLVVSTPLFDQSSFIDKLEEYLSEADVMVCTHVSNVFGYVLPIERIALLCERYSVPLIIDASQSAGILNLDFSKLNADFVAMPGHKGLMGPQGTGILICKNEASPLLYGGSGSMSLMQDMPDILPDRLEAGTHNVMGIAGLNASLEYIRTCGLEKIQNHEWRLLDCAASELSELNELKVFYSGDKKAQSGVLSILPYTMSCEELGERLSENDIAVRVGLHCAPLAHKTVGTDKTGTVRLSFSPFNNETHICEACEVIRKIIKKA